MFASAPSSLWFCPSGFLFSVFLLRLVFRFVLCLVCASVLLCFCAFFGFACVLLRVCGFVRFVFCFCSCCSRCCFRCCSRCCCFCCCCVVVLVVPGAAPVGRCCFAALSLCFFAVVVFVDLLHLLCICNRSSFFASRHDACVCCPPCQPHCPCDSVHPPWPSRHELHPGHHQPGLLRCCNRKPQLQLGELRSLPGGPFPPIILATTHRLTSLTTCTLFLLRRDCSRAICSFYFLAVKGC